MTEIEYNKLKATCLIYKYHPDFTGDYLTDMKLLTKSRETVYNDHAEQLKNNFNQLFKE